MYTLPEAVQIFKRATNPLSAFPVGMGQRNEKTFPPYNMISYFSEDGTEFEKLVLEVSVAGYAKEDIQITFSQDSRCLSIHGTKKIKYPETRKDGKGGELPKNAEYVHRGIASRTFTTEFTILEDLEIGETKLENGILTIELNYIKPKQKEQTVRIITIN